MCCNLSTAYLGIDREIRTLGSQLEEMVACHLPMSTYFVGAYLLYFLCYVYRPYIYIIHYLT